MSVFIPIPKKGSAKECSDYQTILLITHASKVLLKILQGSFQQYLNQEFHMDGLDLEKAEGPEVKLPTSVESWRKEGGSRKASISASLTTLKPLCISQQTVESS